MFILLFLFSIPVVAQDGEPSYKFKLENKEYAIYITQSEENATYDTLYYNLYRVGKAKRIVKEIQEVVYRILSNRIGKLNPEKVRGYIQYFF